jgi:hypothetical protein
LEQNKRKKQDTSLDLNIISRGLFSSLLHHGV